MCCMRFTMSSSDRKEVEHQLKTAQHLGNLRQVKYLLAILAVMDGQRFRAGRCGLTRAEENHCQMGRRVLLLWPPGCTAPESLTGRPPKLTPTQQAALATLH